MDVKTIITAVLLFTGCFFIVVAAIGVVRFPDFFARMHPAGKGDTLGQALILLSLMVYEGFTLITVKLFIIMVFILVANPTGSHFIAKGAYVAGVKPTKVHEEVDISSSEVAVSSTSKKHCGVDSAS
ncbi:MAG: monovalent cation/H(+) antiporter subunit G [Clostridia bacterium]|nr:monovalent cation/H(+) antiporter subunit G [Clostridia bacterium]